ncbi:MAG: type IV pili methyl-accepting chemotaxis transducer N-terminal domain-containing protein [Chitinivorax sp.]|jgi:hypothetical protein
MRIANINRFLGKYREIVVAVAFFLVFDLAVLLLNVYISIQVTADATAINMAGRQRMLTQRISKAVLVIETDSRADVDTSAELAELQNTATLFDETLTAFNFGGPARGGDNRPVQLQAIESVAGMAALQQAVQLW